MLKLESQDAKSYKSAQHEQCNIENVVLPEEIRKQEETSSDQEQEDIDQESSLDLSFC